MTSDCLSVARWKVFFTVLVVYYLGLSVFQHRKELRKWLFQYTRITLSQGLRCAGIIFVALVVGLNLRQVEGFGWTWTQYFFGEQGGSLLVTPLISTETVSIEVHRSYVGPVFMLVIFGMLIALMPLIAYYEEKIFRSWIRTRRDNAISAMLFGPAHILMGVPIAGWCVLSALGYWYGTRYLKARQRHPDSVHDALMESSREHLACNSIVIGMSLLSLVIYIGGMLLGIF